MPNYLESKISEAELLEGCIKGDRKCQKALYDAYSGKMFGVCMRYARNYHNAEDLLQEGFIRVFNSIKSFRKDGSLEGWVRKVVINTAIEILRQAVHVRSIDEVNGIELKPFEDGMEYEAEADELLRMIQSLSDGYRTIFNLYAMEGYSHEEIAKMLGINVGTSKSQLARAKVILQKKIIESRQYKVYDQQAQTR